MSEEATEENTSPEEGPKEFQSDREFFEKGVPGAGRNITAYSHNQNAFFNPPTVITSYCASSKCKGEFDYFLMANGNEKDTFWIPRDERAFTINYYCRNCGTIRAISFFG